MEGATSHICGPLPTALYFHQPFSSGLHPRQPHRTRQQNRHIVLNHVQFQSKRRDKHTILLVYVFNMRSKRNYTYPQNILRNM